MDDGLECAPGGGQDKRIGLPPDRASGGWKSWQGMVPPGAAFKRQVAAEFLAAATLHGLSQRHDVSRRLIRIWIGKYEAGALDGDIQAADLLQEYEAKIATLERMVGRQALNP